jgi:integrase
VTYRTRGTGSVVQRKDGRWVARMYNGWEDGKRKVDSFYGATAKEAERKLRHALNEKEQGQAPLSQTVTVGQWLEEWLAGKADVRDSTRRRYEQVCRFQLVPKLGHIRLAKLSASNVSGALRALSAEGKSPRTVFLVRTVLRASLRDAVRLGKLNRNAAADARPPKVEDRDPIILHPSAVAALTEASGPELARAITVAVHTGLRWGEQFGLTWQDVDMDRRCLNIHQGLVRVRGGGQTLGPLKTRRSRRVVPLTAAAVTAFQEEREAQAVAREAAGSHWNELIPGSVFTDATGSPRKGQAVLDGLHGALERAGLPALRWHDLRGGSAGLLLSAGVDLAVVSNALQIEASEKLGRLLAES